MFEQDAYGFPQRQPGVKPTPERFTGDQELIFDEADWVEVIKIAPFYDPLNLESPELFVAFSRPAKVPVNGDMVDGQQAVFYRCDSRGNVTNWERRYEVSAHNYQYAVRKFRLQYANGLIGLDKSPTEAGEEDRH